MSGHYSHLGGLATKMAQRAAKPRKGPSPKRLSVPVSVKPRGLTILVDKIVLTGRRAHVERMGQRSAKHERWHRDAAQQFEDRKRAEAQRQARLAAAREASRGAKV